MGNRDPDETYYKRFWNERWRKDGFKKRPEAITSQPVRIDQSIAPELADAFCDAEPGTASI